jgi:hypothetical protein
MLASSPSRFTLLHFIVLIIFGGGYRLLNYSYFSFLQAPVTVPLVGPDIALSNMFSDTHTHSLL